LNGSTISRWKANWPEMTPAGLVYLDVAFRAARLAVEIDGRIHQRDLALFESDRWRQNTLVLQGWRVLRFTWLMLLDQPDQVIQTVRTALTSESRTAADPGRPRPRAGR